MSYDQASGPTAKAAEAGQDLVIQSAAIAQRVLHLHDLPTWMQVDPLIKRGYRRQLDSFHACFWSLFYPHNELINIWSHLLPGCFFLWLLPAANYSVLFGDIEVSRVDGWVLQLYIAGAAGCLFLSAVFHAINAHSHDIARYFLKLDYIGIVMNISVTNISSTYFGLHGRLGLQTLYMMLSIACAVAVFRALLKPHVDGPGAAWWRAAILIALGTSGFAPMVHVFVVEGIESLAQFPLVHTAITCLCYLTGAGFYVMRIPEKYRPNTFDLLGASHQIFHILVAIGQVVFLLGLKNNLSKGIHVARQG